MNNSLHINTVTWTDAQQALRELRTNVFVREQHVSVEDEWDGKDENATHFLITTSDNQAIGCARLLIEKDNATEVFHIGRVAVLAHYRGQGIGQQLMQFVLHWCTQHNAKAKIYLHAQTTRILFYERLGFVVQGNIFMDAGIAHQTMWFQL